MFRTIQWQHVLNHCQHVCTYISTMKHNQPFIKSTNHPYFKCVYFFKENVVKLTFQKLTLAVKFYLIGGNLRICAIKTGHFLLAKHSFANQPPLFLQDTSLYK